MIESKPEPIVEPEALSEEKPAQKVSFNIPQPEMTGSEIVAQKNLKSNPSSVNENYVSEQVGINKFREEPKAVIDSPLKRKRSTITKLHVRQEDDEQTKLDKRDEDFDLIQPLFDTLVANFAARKDELAALNAKSDKDI